jgi:Uma2 family endonuclease
MSEPVDKKKRATYQDVLDAPEGVNAEIVNGELHLWPRPAGPATSVASKLQADVGSRFSIGRGGPGGWLILTEPEIHVAEDIVDPDLAGWRRERLAMVPDAAFFTVIPDWVCEVLSPSTERFDRAEKLPLFAQWGVKHAWLVNPRQRTLEAYRLENGGWRLLGVYQSHQCVRVEPFEEVELDLSVWWSDVPLSAKEPAAEYGTAL